MIEPELNLNQYIEYTALGSDLDDKKILEHVLEALHLNTFGICLPLAFVPLAKKAIAKRPLRLITVIDFPYGKKSPLEKALEAKTAKEFGADEIDMVIDYEAILNQNYDLALEGIKKVVEVFKVVKVIIETSALSKYQIAIAASLVSLGGAQYIKTSTGFHKKGARLEDIFLIRSLLPKNIKIKASGGIKTKDEAISMIKAGADRIGTSKASDILLS